MLIPKKNRLAILTYLFKEGVLVANKDIALPKHMVLEVPNLHVVKLMQSLKSKDYITVQYNWGYLYYRLNNKGIDALREELHIPGDTVPATLQKRDKPQPAPSFGSGRFVGEDGEEQRRGGFGDRGDRGDRGGRGRGGGFRGSRGGFDGPRRGGRDEYRGPKKLDGDAPRNFNPEFDGRRGGFRGSRGGERGGFRGSRGGRGGRDTADAAPAGAAAASPSE